MQRHLLALALLSALGPAHAPAAAFRSYATVLDVQPVIETYYEAVTRRVCSDPHNREREFTELSATIAEDIRHQLHRWRAQRSCTTVTEREPRERVTAYRVTYRYRGYTATTRLPYHPGDRLPVNVSLSPLP
jgi:uncharacterized protein YcfJ